MHTQVKFLIEIHAYVNEHLCDEVFDDVVHHGIHGPEIMQPLANNRTCELQFEYDNSTTLNDACIAIINKLQVDELYVKISFIYNGIRYYCGDGNAQFSFLARKYLDPKNTGKITAYILVSMNAGAVACDDGIRYFMHSRESGKHNEPHVHIRTTDHNHTAVLALSNGRIIAGKFPQRLLKKAQKFVKMHNEFFCSCWCTMTDGLQPDINKYFGMIEY